MELLRIYSALFSEKIQYRNKYPDLSDFSLTDGVNIAHLGLWMHTVIMGREELVILLCSLKTLWKWGRELN